MSAYQYAAIVTAGYIILQIFGGLAISRLSLRRFIIFHIFSGFFLFLLTAVTAILGILARAVDIGSVSAIFAILAFLFAGLQIGTGARLYLSKPALLPRHLIIALMTFGLAFLAAVFALL